MQADCIQYKSSTDKQGAQNDSTVKGAGYVGQFASNGRAENSCHAIGEKAYRVKTGKQLHAVVLDYRGSIDNEACAKADADDYDNCE